MPENFTDFGDSVECTLPTAEFVCEPSNTLRYLNEGVIDAGDIVAAVDNGDFTWEELHSYDSVVLNFLQQAPFKSQQWVTDIATIRANCPGLKIYADLRWDIWWANNFQDETPDDPNLAWGTLSPKPTAAMGDVPRDVADSNPGGITWANAKAQLLAAGYAHNSANEASFLDANGNDCLTNPVDVWLDSPVVGEFEVSGNQMDMANTDWLDLYCDYASKLCDALGLDGVVVEPVKINDALRTDSAGNPRVAQNPTLNHFITQTGGTANGQGPQSDGNPDNTWDIATNTPAWNTTGKAFDDKSATTYDVIAGSFYLARCFKSKGKRTIYGCQSNGVDTWRSTAVMQEFTTAYVANGGAAGGAEQYYWDELAAMKAESDDFFCSTATGVFAPGDESQEWVENLGDCQSGAGVINPANRGQDVPI